MHNSAFTRGQLKLLRIRPSTDDMKTTLKVNSRVIYPKRIGIGLGLGLWLGLELGLGLASNFRICTTTFRTNDPSDK